MSASHRSLRTNVGDPESTLHGFHGRLAQDRRRRQLSSGFAGAREVAGDVEYVSRNFFAGGARRGNRSKIQRLKAYDSLETVLKSKPFERSRSMFLVSISKDLFVKQEKKSTT